MPLTCKICNSAGSFNEYSVKEMLYGTRERFDYFQCSHCGCLQIKEFPRDLARYYPDDYYSKNINFDEIVKEKKVRRNIESLSKYLSHPVSSKLHFKDQNLNIIPFMTMTRDDHILDIGCGTGRLIYIMKEAGFQNVSGADPFIEDEIKYANGLRIYKKSIDQMPSEAKWDFIMFHHSFEHVTNPLEVLEYTKNLLKEDGKVVIRIPVVGYAWEKYGVDWYQLDAPRHLFLHSKESMRYLADKAGLKIDDIKYDSTSSQFLNSEKYQKNIPLIQEVPRSKGIRRIKDKYKKWKYKRMSNSLNNTMNGDQAAFILKK
jgi:SAM-dependent methyltransferase